PRRLRHRVHRVGRRARRRRNDTHRREWLAGGLGPPARAQAGWDDLSLLRGVDARPEDAGRASLRVDRRRRLLERPCQDEPGVDDWRRSGLGPSPRRSAVVLPGRHRLRQCLPGRQRRHAAQRLQPLLRLQRVAGGRYHGPCSACVLVERDRQVGLQYEKLDEAGGATAAPVNLAAGTDAQASPSINRLPLVAAGAGNTFMAWPGARHVTIAALGAGKLRRKFATGTAGAPRQVALAVEPDGTKLWVVWAQGKYLWATRRRDAAHAATPIVVRTPLPAGRTPYTLEAVGLA